VKNAFVNWAQNQNSSIVFVESAILLESIMSNAIDKVILVYASEETRVARVMSRESVSAETVYPRIRNQKSFVELKEKAHYLIENDNNRLVIPQVENILTSLSSDI
jgi:dephospho-CoA kinase